MDYVNYEKCRLYTFSPPARWGLLDFMSVACSPPLLSSSSCSTATLDAQCSLSDLNHDHPRPVFPAGPQPRPSPPSVPCRTSTTTIHAQCSLPDLNREYPRQVFPAGPHVGRYGTKNVQKKVRKNVRQVCYILLANSRVCGRVTGAMPLLTLQVAKFEAISLNRWQSHWGGQRHFHFCTFGAVCKDAWDRQHLTASYYKLLEVISCWIDAWELTDKLETKAASTLERLQSWPVYDALQASWHSALPVGPNRFWLKRSGGGIGLTRCFTCGT